MIASAGQGSAAAIAVDADLVQEDVAAAVACSWADRGTGAEVDDANWYSGGHLGFMTAPVARRCLDDALVDAGLARRQDGHLVAVS